MILREMTADEALKLAKYQRPGIRLIVGPERAREELVKPITWEEWRKLR